MSPSDKQKILAALESIPEGVSKWDLDLLYCVVILRRYNGQRLKSAKVLGISYRCMMGYIGMLPDDVPPAQIGAKNLLDLDAVLRALIAHDGSRKEAAAALKISRCTLLRYTTILRQTGHQVPSSPKGRYDVKKEKVKKKRRVKVRVGSLDYDQIS